MRNWAVVRGHAPGGGFPCESTYAELRIRQIESAVPEVRLSGCLGDRERMEQGCECLSGAGNALSDQCGAYLLHLFAKIHFQLRLWLLCLGMVLDFKTEKYC